MFSKARDLCAIRVSTSRKYLKHKCTSGVKSDSRVHFSATCIRSPKEVAFSNLSQAEIKVDLSTKIDGVHDIRLVSTSEDYSSDSRNAERIYPSRNFSASTRLAARCSRI